MLIYIHCLIHSDPGSIRSILRSSTACRTNHPKSLLRVLAPQSLNFLKLLTSTSSPFPFLSYTNIDLLRFLRDEQLADSSTKSWNEQLAEKYYANLYKEFAVCDLKHYKSGNVSLLNILLHRSFSPYTIVCPSLEDGGRSALRRRRDNVRKYPLRAPSRGIQSSSDYP